ncbi:hypothetical protein ABZY09_39285 [Streptomyces sp. NPDC002928]|uniref:hypothetical protein n=1 Tax=Streptomyces sp. NPDC002928 TaxID=3154440 RepID=UPI0033A4988C
MNRCPRRSTSDAGWSTAGLETLRLEHPGLSRHTLGSHFQDSRPFWTAVGTDVPGSYQQRETVGVQDVEHVEDVPRTRRNISERWTVSPGRA